MVVEQVSFAIPPDITARIAVGELFRHGGVVRDSAGHIVMHLKEVPTPKLDQALQAARRFAQQNKPALLIGTAAAAAITGSAFVVSAMKRHKYANIEKRVKEAVSEYFNAIVEQKMNLPIINELNESLRELRQVTGKTAFELLDNNVLEFLIAYSQDFILHNNAELEEAKEFENVVSLEDYLAKQKEIFNQAC